MAIAPEEDRVLSYGTFRSIVNESAIEHKSSTAYGRVAVLRRQVSDKHGTIPTQPTLAALDVRLCSLRVPCLLFRSCVRPSTQCIGA